MATLQPVSAVWKPLPERIAPGDRVAEYSNPLANMPAMRQSLVADAFERQSAASSSGSRPYGIQNYGMQSYLPIMERRELNLQEEVEVHKGLTRWWPKLFPDYGTPLTDMLASPARSALLAALPAGLLGLASSYGLLGGAVAAAVAAILAYFYRQQQNGNLLEMQHRLPEAARLRDLQADPVWQAQANRNALGSRSARGWDGLQTGMAAANLFGNLWNPRGANG